jgi:hypothetical protein
MKPLRWTKDGECERCGYCGFTAHADYWLEREWQACKRYEARQVQAATS